MNNTSNQVVKQSLLKKVAGSIKGNKGPALIVILSVTINIAYWIWLYFKYGITLGQIYHQPLFH